jgi:Cu(I)/Ag(I) efflux system membrane fusion protein
MKNTLPILFAVLGLASCSRGEASPRRQAGDHSGHGMSHAQHGDHAGHAPQPAKPSDHAGHVGHGDHQPAPPVKLGPAAGAQATSHAGHPRRPAAAGQPPVASTSSVLEPPEDPPTPATGSPPGYAHVPLDRQTVGALNLTSVVVEERALAKTVRTVGVVAPDERRTSHVHAKVRGFIEGIRVDFVGQEVKRGQALLSIYSQEVLAAELEFVALLEAAPPPKSGGVFADMERRTREQVVAAARRRLSLWDVPRAEIERLERTREPRRTFTLASPQKGVVVAKQALDGTYVEPATELYTITDLSKVWVLVDIYEADVPMVELGQEARLSFAGLEGKSVTAKATFVAPTLDEATRTLKIRYEVDNPDRKLRPGTFATAEIDLSLGRGLTVPESAVIRTGQRDLVFVVHDEHAEPREVRVGALIGGQYRVQAGLVAGERVATGAQFLLDSESRLRATSAPGGAHAGH